MQTFHISGMTLNIGKLTTELQQAGIAVIGISEYSDDLGNPTGEYDIDVPDGVTLEEVMAVVDAHDPTDEGEAAVDAAIQWFEDNPQIMQIVNKTVPDLQTELYALVDALFPNATQGNRTKMKLFLMGLAMQLRIWIKQRGLDE